MSNIVKEAQKVERLYYFDWLRIIAFVFVVLIHCIHMFHDLYKAQGGNALGGLSDALTYFIPALTQWCMALYFLLAGASTWFALRRKSPKQFLQERVTRLLVPLVVGFVLLVPLQAYVALVSNGEYAGSLLSFYPFFLGRILFHWDFNLIVLHIHHLWFLAYLFGFSLLALPLCLYLRGESGRKWLTRLATICEQPGGLLLLGLPLMLLQLTLRPAFPQYCSLTDAACWILCYIYGYALFANPRFKQALQQQGKYVLGWGAIGFMAMVALWHMGLLAGWFTTPAYTMDNLLYQALSSSILWTCLVATLAAGNALLNIKCAFLTYGSAASFHWYLLHFPLVVISAYYILPLHLNGWLTFASIGASSLLSTLILADLLLLRRRGVQGTYNMLSKFMYAYRPASMTNALTSNIAAAR